MCKVENRKLDIISVLIATNTYVVQSIVLRRFFVLFSKLSDFDAC